MRTVRSVVRALSASIAVLLAVVGPMLMLSAPQAAASSAQQQSSQADAAHTAAIAISITGMTPQVATPSSTVTISGTLANRTGAPVSGITVQAKTSSMLFSGRKEMSDFTSAGGFPYQLGAAGNPEVTGAVPNGATRRWSVTFPAVDFYGQFGVFPVQVQATSAGGQHTASADTFLVYWPGGSAAGQPAPLQAAWVWPLVDTPQQGACGQTLATSQLSRSVAAGGRLSTLLSAGATYAQTDNLTWDIDPALLSDVSVMTSPYSTVSNASCTGRTQQQASSAAQSWLTELRATSAGQPAFATPYANVDVAALSHAGLDTSIKAAYQLGKTVAGQILPGTFGTSGTGITGTTGTTDGTVLKAAWPTDGLADSEVLTNLANDGGVNTVILNSNEISSTTGYDDAVARTTSGIGTSLSVLLADSDITSLLGTASAAGSQSGQFALVQDFLAETAMISSEAPNLARSLVIAPPTGWDPSAGEASALLKITSGTTPWLHSVGLSRLATEASKLTATEALPAKQVNHQELSAGYLAQLASVQSSLSVFEDLLYQPPARLIQRYDAAIAAVASSAWRGKASAGGWLALTQLKDFLQDSENKVQIISSKKVLLAGASGETPVSVRNGLGLPIQVQVMASTPVNSQLQVGPFVSLIKVQALKTGTVRMPVRSTTIGTTTVQLQLVTPNGSPLAWTKESLSVEVTRVGRFVLLIIGGALGILVLTSAVRLRRKRLAARHENNADDTANAGGAG
jgi:Family of unknown function (DUF6049)